MKVSGGNHDTLLPGTSYSRSLALKSRIYVLYELRAKSRLQEVTIPGVGLAEQLDTLYNTVCTMTSTFDRR